VSTARRFPCHPRSVAAARQFTRQILSDQSSAVVDAIELMVSELATNSVRHANSDFELAIDSKDQIRVEVRDSGGGQPTLRSPAPLDTSGRGLRIVEAMSDTWGIIPTSDGKTVWFELTRAAGDEAPEVAAAKQRQAQQRADPASHDGQGGGRVRGRVRRTPRASCRRLVRLQKPPRRLQAEFTVGRPLTAARIDSLDSNSE
jgi:anti-sigma regulatory factor (Ser/Thr protein kinase)